jgi:N-methylhydantoinase B/oxoprolinase/acetone carboxylase alpha subunit
MRHPLVIAEQRHCETSPGTRLALIAHSKTDWVDREPGRVASDVSEGYVTRARAEAVYGVVLDATGAVDAAATVRRRADLRA